MRLGLDLPVLESQLCDPPTVFQVSELHEQHRRDQRDACLGFAGRIHGSSPKGSHGREHSQCPVNVGAVSIAL